MALARVRSAWIESRVAALTGLVEQRTERSALAFRRLAGPVVLTPKKPDIGKAYSQASCSPARVRRKVRVYCDGGAAGNRTPVRKASDEPSFTCVVALTLATGFRGFGHDLTLRESRPRY